MPISLVPNLDGVNVTMDFGRFCGSGADSRRDLCIAFCSWSSAFRYDNEAFRDEMNTQHHVGTFEYRGTEGAHAWRWWTRWLRERHLPFMWNFLAKPQPASSPVVPTAVPTSFRYRSISPRFSVYGFDVSVTRAQREFLDLDLRNNTLTLTGTGMVDLTVPDGRRSASTSVPDTRRSSTRLKARIQEAAGQYGFVTKTIDLTPVAGTKVGADTLVATGGSTNGAAVGAVAGSRWAC